ncbi:MAG: phosphoribosyltransferase family protein [Burkholderiaceae bacterium]
MKPFRDRDDAARQLAKALAPWRGANAVVYAIPRGAIPMAVRLAEELDAELDVVLTHKLGAPGNPEFAIGAVAESGWSHLQDHGLDIGAAYVQRETAAQLERLRERRRNYGAARVPATDRTAIVVDDGLATGSTMIAALHALRQQGPSRLICAVPVAAADSLSRVRPLADELVCLHAPPDFHAVGQYYEHFEQVDDAHVIAALQGARQAARPARP